MFGTDTNNQAQTTQPTTMGLASPSTQPSEPAQAVASTPTISNDSPSLTLPSTNTEIPETSSIPEFVPPDTEGNMSKPEQVSAQPTEDLASIKKEALSKLGPLVDKLEQTPEEKFKTLMMMIQASDDQSLVSKAYHAAETIEDENVKARALLDIINEINYFTNQSTKED